MTSSSPTLLSVPGTEVVVHVAAGRDAVTVELRGRLDAPDPSVAAATAETIRRATSTAATVHLVADHPADRLLPVPTLVADQLGAACERELLQLRRALPVPDDDPVRAGAAPLALRAFDPERDRAAWIRANNRAFASHPDQGNQTPDRLDATLAEPWVDLGGFLVADDAQHPGAIAGSCWTKVHPPTADDPALGEIFVIGVDPDHHGRGLGRSLVLAGLDHLAERGLSTAMLYVEADNAPALALYERLGFTPHLRRRICTR